MLEHQGHHYEDLEETYAENFAFCQNEVSKIQKYFLPTSKDIKQDIKEDAVKIKSVMESFRTSMKAEAESLKGLVDVVTSENIEQTHSMEKSLLEMLESQETTYSDYITSLEKLLQKICMTMATETFSFCSSAIVEQFKIPNIPETTKPGLPVLTTCQYSKNDVFKLLRKVQLPDSVKEKRKIKPMVIISTQLNCIEKQRKQESKKSDMKQTLCLSSSVSKVRECRVPGVTGAFHVSLEKAGRLWVSDDIGNLVQTDIQGNALQKIQTSGYRDEGYHTATQDGDLIYTDKVNKLICKITPYREINEFVKTGDWTPLSIHPSSFNGDILVGMIKQTVINKKARVTRYNKTGKKIQNIQKRKNQGQKLYLYPRYITENINGDICTSDDNKCAVVVVNKSGQYRFSYKGQRSEFRPWGICTDVLGHILVCDSVSGTVYLLDQDGGFLSVIFSPQEGIKCPRGVCVDDQNNLYVGKNDNNTVTVYKYLQ